ncbi:MAG: response regulator, partial [Gammaproteobacteria bacterium]|nr:response regulator [Gammaproteobacteria bacterium]
MNCELLEAMLVPEGYAIEQAHSGAEALASVERRRPDMVLLDVNMPVMDGFEVACRLRDDERTRAVPVVMVTALGDLDHRVRGLESGADDYLTKPVSRAELLARVQSSLRLSWLRAQVDERRKLELVLGDVSDGIVIVDANARVVDASPSAQRFLTMEDAPSMLDTVWAELRGVPADLGDAVARGVRHDFIVRRETPALFVRVSMRPVHDPNGNPTGAVLSLRDVTQESVDFRLQQDVLSLISHKFRTPLTVVHSWTGVLLEDGCEPLQPQQREALRAVAAATQQLRDMLDGILGYV